jgi:tRNA threonylcarbamoyladenosine biosynthesis protein TsaE
MKEEFVSHSAEQTIAFGRTLASRIRSPLLILLIGELGSGKTTLVKGMVSGLGAANEYDVTSPTFTLVHEYRGKIRLFHVDLYRVESLHDLETLGLEDILAEEAVVVVEWGEKLRPPKNVPTWTINFQVWGNSTRQLLLED